MSLGNVCIITEQSGSTGNLVTKKGIIMADKKNSAKETERMRKERIAGTDNGRTLRTRVVKDKKKYSRKKKHKKEEDF